MPTPYKGRPRPICDSRDDDGYPCKQVSLHGTCYCEEHIYRDADGLARIEAALRARLAVVLAEKELVRLIDLESGGPGDA
jgi:hypothetical protein